MYLQITTRCNMTCEHCCFNCTNEGEDMSVETFEKALELYSNHGFFSLALGGGEPTIHPKFWQLFGMALGNEDRYNEGSLWLATNGSVSRIAIRLANMARKGIIGCALSQDQWHDPISDKVRHAFEDGMRRRRGDQWYPDSSRIGHEKDLREIRDNSHSIADVGRASVNGLANARSDTCCCGGIVIKPNGDIWSCTAQESHYEFGTVYGPQIPDGWNVSECHTSSEQYTIDQELIPNEHQLA